MLRKQLFSGLFFLVSSSCTPGHFWGDLSVIGFYSDVRFSFDPWTPDVPLAVGSSIKIVAEYTKESDEFGNAIPPWVEPENLSHAVFSEETVERNQYLATVFESGATVLGWRGTQYDEFTVISAAPTVVGLQDPINGRKGGYRLESIIQTVWDDPVDVISIYPQTNATFDYYLESQNFTKLAFSGSSVSCSINNESAFSIVSEPYTCAVSISQLQPFTSATLFVDYGASLSRTYHLSPTPDTEVTGIVASYGHTYGYDIFVANATLASGDKLWGAPIEWHYDPLFWIQQHDDITSTIEGRRDVLVLRWIYNKEGPYSTTVTASINGIEHSIPFSGFNYGYYYNRNYAEPRVEEATCKSSTTKPQTYVLLFVLAIWVRNLTRRCS